MLTSSDLERALAAAGLEAPVRFDEVTGSTNATAIDLAEADAPEWTLVAAGHQTQGRGRLGRTWVDRPGGALMFSFVLRPEIDPSRAGLLPLLAGASMASAARDAGAPEVRCKWPNDLLVEGGGKVGGILVETSFGEGRLRYAVVGIGLNLGPPPVKGAAALEGVGASVVLSAFFNRFSSRYPPFVRGDKGSEERIIEEWSAASATLGRTVRAERLDGGPAVVGVAVAVDRMGALVVEESHGRVSISSGEIAHIG